eukprot:COSAG01_NODE_70332_length_259_cov_0.500000_1_plen_44_part_10
MRYFDSKGRASCASKVTGEQSCAQPVSFRDAEPGDAQTEVVEQA